MYKNISYNYAKTYISTRVAERTTDIYVQLCYLHAHTHTHIYIYICVYAHLNRYFQTYTHLSIPSLLFFASSRVFPSFFDSCFTSFLPFAFLPICIYDAGPEPPVPSAPHSMVSHPSALPGCGACGLAWAPGLSPVGWCLWCSPFVRAGRNTGPLSKLMPKCWLCSSMPASRSCNIADSSHAVHVVHRYSYSYLSVVALPSLLRLFLH